MGARRRAGPAAIAAALIGAGLALYRPRLVPELRAGSRGAPAPAVSALAAAVARPRVHGLAPPDSGSGGGPMAARPEAASGDASWRDAIADRSFAAAER
ncbi:MAG: hypothetical protein PHS14_19670, partial [Elusimicrobia bacterium]|nr:hypothetical protein [Elusimicrobiota bacterium]